VPYRVRRQMAVVERTAAALAITVIIRVTTVSEQSMPLPAPTQPLCPPPANPAEPQCLPEGYGGPQSTHDRHLLP
jgi:hypothetical protein